MTAPIREEPHVFQQPTAYTVTTGIPAGVEVLQWLVENCQSYDLGFPDKWNASMAFRFTVRIYNEEEAVHFKLRWM